MKFTVLTLFPEIYAPLYTGIVGRGLAANAFELQIANIRDFSKDKHKKTDDAPYGGGLGMVMTPQPLFDAITAADPEHKALRIYLSPKGKIFNAAEAKRLSKLDHIVLINGAYEGIDERVIELCIDEELSLGDFVLTSGDYASLAIINASVRHINGVLGDLESTVDESFENNKLEYPQYTRPPVFNGLSVPEILLSGDHGRVDAWRESESLKVTQEKRPDLLK
ncbi:MAG: tRNA (guanosine(37)-N1)-methyltransferase TrmD [Christensenellaceae bacterium]|jgi:tRNA (guanine37-N1)-methyltransferase|nr:tRNA (guanosine(37)-N1)-methyltransferase TrmD [Christensenellaceae bacterium]